jgi:hypothetical protein
MRLLDVSPQSEKPGTLDELGKWSKFPRPQQKLWTNQGNFGLIFVIKLYCILNRNGLHIENVLGTCTLS